MKDKILQLLRENTDSFVSGQSLSDKLGVSRTAIWKYINSLKEDGYEIESISKKGHRLISTPDILNYEEIKEHLHTNIIGRNILYYQSLDSTNNKAKEIAKDSIHGTVIISEEQTSGRGRLGRSWVAPKLKGVWMSIILKPDTDPLNIPKVTQVGAAAVVKALQQFNIAAQVKWPNDIIINGKKVCGILTEMSGELNVVNYVIMGIGINVNMDENEISRDILPTATSIKIETGIKLKRKELVSSLLNNFELLYKEFESKGTIDETVKICKENSALIGKDVRIISRSKETLGRAIDLSDDGELVVQYNDGNIEKIISGEISIRGLNSYV